MIEFDKSPYRSFSPEQKLFARYKTGGKEEYLAFSSKYKAMFDTYHINYTAPPSDTTFIRVGLDIFSPLVCEPESISKIFDEVYLQSVNFPGFGCCGLYVKCSNEKNCVHDDFLYASSACQYKRHLDAGRIFYGLNKNV